MRWPRLILIVVLIAGAGLGARWWLAPLLELLGAQADLIQTASAFAALVGVLGGAFFGLRAFVRKPARPEGQARFGDSAGISAVERSVAIGGSATGNTFILGDGALADSARELRKRSPAALRETTERYLRFVRDRYRYLELKGLGVSDLPMKVELLRLYVPLKARPELPEGETWERGALLAGRELSEEDAERLGRRLSEPQPVLELLQDAKTLVILGDPGSGKTTFLKMLALALAAGRGEELGLGRRLPLLLPLSAYAKALEEGDPRLDDFIAAYLHQNGLDKATGMIKADLEAGRLLLLLDGLDEVRTPAQRQVVLGRVVNFVTYHCQKGNRCVLTSRIVGYRDVKTTAEGLEECTLVDFDREEITGFVGRWTSEVEQQARGETEVAGREAERERNELLEAVEANPGVRRLAANPLMLTILALMKRQGVHLPDRRVELYKNYVDTLLSSWNRARSLDRPLERELDASEAVRVLAPLALWMHETDPGLGLVERPELKRRLTAIFKERGAEDAEGESHRFLADVRQHTGLLLERGTGQYGFLHLTFEEYLAAVGVAFEAQGDADRIAAWIAERTGRPEWREVVLLLVGYVSLVQNLDRVAGSVLEKLVERKSAEAVVLAGETLLDTGSTGVPGTARRRVVEALIEVLQPNDTAPVLRHEAGHVLGRLGDPRLGVGVLKPEGSEPLPAIDWLEVPAGTFLMGSSNDDELAFDREKPQHEVDLERFWIGRYPVTNAQYRLFVESGELERRELWTDAGWEWFQGAEVDVSVYPEDWHERMRDWYAGRPKEKRRRPFYWDHPRLGAPNRPVVGITFFEALAFSRWLDERLRQARREVWEQLKLEPLQRYAVSLPSEAQWERAARGTDGRTWPWGEPFRDGDCNSEEVGLAEPSPVGLFDHRKSPRGAADMAGNVWEWTTTIWSRRSFETADFEYPYSKQDSRDELEGESLRIFRGGSFYNDKRHARCAARSRYIPEYFVVNGGFRVVFSLASSEY